MIEEFEKQNNLIKINYEKELHDLREYIRMLEDQLQTSIYDKN